MSTLIVNGAGLALMAFVVWWFWLWQPKKAVQASGGVIDITVDNGVYDPAWIEAKAGEPLTLRFHRKDPAPCAEQVVFHGLDISEELPVGEAKTLRFTPDKPGTYPFTCQMQMYRGELRVTA